VHSVTAQVAKVALRLSDVGPDVDLHYCVLTGTTIVFSASLPTEGVMRHVTS
jgi:hypothetical protein